MVVLAHVIRGIAAPAVNSYEKPWLYFVSDGTLAVYIFFVISGFALSCGFFETGRTSILAQLALRRYPRLTLPILASCLISFALLETGLVFNHEAAIYAKSAFWLGTFFGFTPAFPDLLRFSLFDVYFSYDPAHTYNSALWTMSTELFGSMFVFGCLALFAETYLIPVYIASMVILILLHSPLVAFLLGMMLANAQTKSQWFREDSAAKTVSGFVVIVTVVALCTWKKNISGDPNIMALVAALLVTAVAQSRTLRAFFERRLSNFLGHISFPLYLVHMSVIVSYSSFLLITLPEHGVSRQATVNYMVLTTLPLCIVAAILFAPIETIAIRASRAFANVISNIARTK